MCPHNQRVNEMKGVILAMEERKNVSVETTADEYSKTAVPSTARKSFLSVLIISLGYVFVVTSMQAGSVIGVSLSFNSMVWAVLVSSAILTVLVTAAATAVLTFLVQKTKLGKAMRAVSEDMGAARLMGINVNHTIPFTFAVGSALAGIGAVLYCMAYTQITPTMGIMLGTKAFVAAVLGGIGSIPGAVIGGLIVGFAEVFVSAIGLSVWQDAVVFLLLIIVLIVKPTGLLGEKTTEKV